MRLDVILRLAQDRFLVPSLRGDLSRQVCVVVDVLRASSTIVTMLEQGVEGVLVAATIAEARRLARELPGYLLCGEEGGLPPAGFDYGNSPREFSTLDLRGRRAILCTTNGTRALMAAAAAPLVLVGCLLNASAVAQAAATTAATGGLDITIVCAGDEGGTAFAAEDALGAGAILDALVSPPPEADQPPADGRREAARLELTDEARAALESFRAQRGREEAALGETPHGRELVALGLADDVSFCAGRDVSAIVPRLERVQGRLRLVALA
ncbi:MAG: 2-phosphosulfolactate phosphatase [Chloroflexota bacterium]|nr:2-phosphosulfolactate phosphatase [Chloroflexota bacterium]